MKYLQSFQEYNYLKESKGNELSELDAYNFFQTYCTWFSEGASKLYRGTDSKKDYMIIESKKVVKNNFLNQDSYDTLLISTLPTWKDYPKRRNSIVCTTNENISSSYGTVYHVLPVDDTKLCITSKNSLDTSFNKTILSKIRINLFSELNGVLDKLFKMINNGEDMNASDETMFYQQLERLKEPEIQQKILSQNETNDTIMMLFQEINKYSGNVKDYFNDALDPVKNGFDLEKVHKFLSISGTKEVWFNGKALLVRNEIFNNFLNNIKK